MLAFWHRTTRLSAWVVLVGMLVALGLGLGSTGSVRLFAPGGTTLIDAYEWTAHASTAQVMASPWPGSPDVQTVDGENVFSGNMSGLAYEPSGSAVEGVLWAARNGPGTLFRLIWNGTIWTPDSANGWGAGKPLRYPDGTGNPDAEGVTFAATLAAGLYVATERNNDASGVSRNSVLRLDATAADTTLTAMNEWNLTADLPEVGANLGLEAITWIPDAFLTSQGFFDESNGHTYVPAEYPNHGDGLFFVGVEANGVIYAYALDHEDDSFKRIATISSGFRGVMGLDFDRELGYLWAVCDDGCDGRSAVLQIAPQGDFVVTRVFERPTAMPNLNNEGFAIVSQAECLSGLKPAFWADDSETGGHAIRRGTLSCTPF